MQRAQKRKRRSGGQEVSRPSWQTALWGLCFAWIVTVIGILLMTAVFYAGWLSGSGGQYQMAAYGIMAVSILTGMLFTFKKTGGKQRIWVLAVAAGYFVIRLLLSAVLTFL